MKTLTPAELLSDCPVEQAIFTIKSNLALTLRDELESEMGDNGASPFTDYTTNAIVNGEYITNGIVKMRALLGKLVGSYTVAVDSETLEVSDAEIVKDTGPANLQFYLEDDLTNVVKYVAEGHMVSMKSRENTCAFHRIGPFVFATEFGDFSQDVFKDGCSLEAISKHYSDKEEFDAVIGIFKSLWPKTIFVSKDGDKYFEL